MPNIVKMLISEEHNLSNPVNFAFETDGNGGTLGSGGKFYEKQYRYALDEQQVQRILDYAQEIDLVGKLEKGRGFISRDYYVLTFDDGSNLTSTCGGYEMTEFLKQLKSELGEPVNKVELEKQAEQDKKLTRAKLLVMTKEQLSEAEAHRRIQKLAMDLRVSQYEIAEDIINGLLI